MIKHHHHHITKILHLKSKLGKLYTHLIIQAFASSMISIFIPIFLLKTGLPLSAVALFLLIQWATFSLVTPIVAKIIHHIGLKEAIIIRTILYVSALILLSLIETINPIKTYYLLIAPIIGFASAMYDLSITSIYAKFMHTKKKGTETSKFLSLPGLGTIFGPAIGGIIAMYAGFTILFATSAIIMIASVIPLSFLKHKLDHPQFEFAKFLQNFKKYKKTFFFLQFYGIKSFIFYIILPISLYKIGQNISNLGLIISTISIIAILFTLWLGKKLDQNTPQKIIQIGAPITFIIMAIFGTYHNSPILVYLAFTTAFVTMLINLPFESILYQQAKESKSPLAYVTFKEFSFLIGRSILFLTLILLLATGIEKTYYLGSISSIIFLLF